MRFGQGKIGMNFDFGFRSPLHRDWMSLGNLSKADLGFRGCYVEADEEQEYGATTSRSFRRNLDRLALSENPEIVVAAFARTRKRPHSGECSYGFSDKA